LSRVPSVALRRHVLRSFAALASAVPLFRPGSSLPGSAAPLLGAPPPAEQPVSTAPRQVLRRTLKASVTEGMVTEVFTACAGATALTAWAIALKLGPFLVGVMTALPFFAQFIQFPAAWLTSTFGHRRVALTAVFLSRVAMLPLCAVPWLPLELAGQQRLLVGIAAISAVLGVVGNNAWVAWMGELVPKSLRGRYFGRRTALCTISGTLASLAAGFLLDRLRGAEGPGLALPLLAGFACVVGFITTYIMSRQHDPSPGGTPFRLDLRATLMPWKDARARRVLLYQVTWNAAVGLSAPYFSFHMIKNLQMTFVIMALHAAAVAGMRVLTAPLWGKAIDRVGAQPVVMACSLGISTIPLLWLLPAQGSLWPLVFDVLLAGGLWSGHGLAVFALPLSVAPRQGRPFYLAAFATTGGLAYAAASAMGGALAGALPATFTLGNHAWVNFHVLFVLSAVARFGAVFFAARIIEPDARSVESLGALFGMLKVRLKAAPALAGAQAQRGEA
jgi:MFS family permease